MTAGPFTRWGRRREFNRELARLWRLRLDLTAERAASTGVDADRLGERIAQLDESRSTTARAMAGLYRVGSPRHTAYSGWAELLHTEAETCHHMVDLSMRTMAAIHKAHDIAAHLATADRLPGAALLAAAPHGGGLRLGATPPAVRLRLLRKGLVDQRSVLTWTGEAVRARLEWLARKEIAAAAAEGVQR